ncbi:MAG: T9SS type A sorting domain-containing protein [Ferruginibacter sp.]
MSFFTCFNLFGQCNINDNTPVSIGQVIVNDAVCPYSGSVIINNVTGGGGEYAYEIISGPVLRIVQSQNQFNALPTGSFLVRVNGCNGTRKDTLVKVQTYYAPVSSAFQIKKINGFTCGSGNDGVYSISNYYGVSPMRFQLSTTNDFSATPFLPGNDSVIVNNLTENTTYYVKIKDGCNNTTVTAFTTPAAVGVAALSVPDLSFTLAQNIVCGGYRGITIEYRDSATGTPYDGRLAYTQSPYWGTGTYPYLRMQIKNTATNQVYIDLYRWLLRQNWGWPYGTHYYFDSYPYMAGNTGLTASQQVGLMMYNWVPTPAIANQVHADYITNTPAGSYTQVPANTPLTATIFFPGGTYCGSTVAPYSKSYNFNIPTSDDPAAKIANMIPQCGGNTYFQVYFSDYFYGKFRIVDPSDPYTVISTSVSAEYGPGYVANAYGNFITGHTYRAILEDKCGRLDSMDMVFTPANGTVASMDFQYLINKEEKCNSLPTDSVYQLAVLQQIGYGINKITIDGIPDSLVTTYSVYLSPNSYVFIKRPLPPGTYTIRVQWSKDCSSGITVQNVTINPTAHNQHYADITGTVTTTASNCYVDGNTRLTINAYLKRNNNDYTLANLRLVRVPNNSVFPLTAMQGILYSIADSALRFSTSTSYSNMLKDSLFTYGSNGLLFSPGQEGNYTFAINVICVSTGAIVETVYKTFTINNIAENRPGTPSLKSASAMMCDGSADMTAYLFTTGGKLPMKYEYKLESSSTFLLTGNAGADSTVTISPAPPAGTVYDIRVTDACGISASSKISLGSFTGKFYIYQTPLDCTVDPFGIKVTTSAITGAYYTWKKNGTIIAQGTNQYYTTITGISVDSISVEINIYGCYFRAGARVIVFNNPCKVTILPADNIKTTGKRLSASHVQINWTAKLSTAKSYFIIQRSADGIHFTDAAIVNAAPMNWEQSFSKTLPDADPLSYYRIVLVNETGQKKYSNTIPLNDLKKLSVSVKIVPNPASDFIKILLSDAEHKTLKGIIYNEKGQAVKTITISDSEMSSGKLIDISTLANGNYYLNIIDNWEIISGSKFIVL